MGNEDHEKEGFESKNAKRRFPSISTYWQYITLPTIVISISTLIFTPQIGYSAFENFLICVFLVSMVLHLIVSVLAVCHFCGKPLTFRPPLKGEAQGKLFFFPLKNCWNCKREVHSPKRTLDNEKLEKFDQSLKSVLLNGQEFYLKFFSSFNRNCILFHCPKPRKQNASIAKNFNSSSWLC